VWKEQLYLFEEMDEKNKNLSLKKNEKKDEKEKGN
jgi:hypothetical protein